MSPILALDRVSRRFGDVVGVAEATLEIDDGAFVTLLGPSGCGKSTLLRMVGGFETPSSGRVLIDGEDVTHVPPHRRPVNMVFQDYALFPHLSVGRNVAFGLRARGARDGVARPSRAEVGRRAGEALELVGLADKHDAMPHELSGGQRQRVALARAVVRRPRVLLLDEPLSALDANLREAMQVELRRLHEEIGLTFVLVTHDQSEALTLSDRVVVMRDGRVRQSGTPDELYERPADPWVATFVGHTNLFDSALERGPAGLVARWFGQPLDVGIGAARGAHGNRSFGFRPEAAELVEPDRRGPNVLRGRVEETLYRGHGARLLVDCGGARVAVDVATTDARGRAALPARGTAVGVHVPARRIMVFDAAAGEGSSGGVSADANSSGGIAA